MVTSATAVHHVRSVAALLLCSQVALSAPSFAAAPAAPAAPAAAGEAEAAMKDGQLAEKTGLWAVARDAYRRSLAARPSVQARFHLALVEERLDLVVEAIDDLEAADRDAQAQKVADVHAQAQKRLPELRKRVAMLVVTAREVPGLVVTLDGKQLDPALLGQPQRANPGAHRVAASGRGVEAVYRNVTLAPGGADRVEIAFDDAGSHAPAVVVRSDSHTGAYVVLGIGLVGLGVGAVAGLQAQQKRDALHKDCPTDVCPAADRALYDQGKLAADVSTAGFVVGALGVVVGAIMLASKGRHDDLDEPRTARITPWVGPGGGGLAGAF